MQPDHPFDGTSAPDKMRSHLTEYLCKVCGLPEGNRKHRAADVERNGTTYGGETPAEVIRLLEHHRKSRGNRLRLYYGDAKTGRAWGDVETGYIGRSSGRIKIPLVIPNARSTGGPGVLDHCIVRIETARGRQVLWSHPTYTPYEEPVPRTQAAETDDEEST